MTSIIEACAVALTLSVITFIVFGVRALRQVGRTLEKADRTLVAVEGLVANATLVSNEVRTLLVSLDAAVARVDGITQGVGQVSHRVVGLSNVLLDKTEAFTAGAVGLYRRVAAAATSLRSRWGDPATAAHPDAELTYALLSKGDNGND